MVTTETNAVEQNTAQRIQILDDNTANQIAAGEVIERPSSVVKELVENALDAGARQIRVNLEDSGKAMIQIMDDGSGMTQEDAILCLQRHATSKIRSAEDLFSIHTMGFRGEAMPSIASVAQMTIVTRPNDVDGDAPGTEIRVCGGKVEDVRAIGARPGTTITVENLFYNVPARLKFLKTNATELTHILELMQRFALARPDVAFRLTQGGSEVFSSTGTGNLLDACVQVYGRDLARHLVVVDHESPGGVRVTGYLGTPRAMKSSRAGQHLFVNHRFVRDKIMLRALDDAYASVQTPHGKQYAVAALLIEIDPSQVDVNVSPTKTEVRFLREGDLFSAVYHAVQNALIERGGLVAKMKMPEKSGPAPFDPLAEQTELLSVPSRLPARAQDDQYAPSISAPRPVGPDPFGDESNPFDEAPRTLTPGPSPSIAHSSPGRGEPEAGALLAAPESYSPLPSEERTGQGEGPGVRAERVPHRETILDLHVLAQTRNMYILAQTDHSLVLIDQHIAHERVLYERLLSGRGGAIPIQHLMIPITLELGRREALVVEKRLDELKVAGFELEPFGGDAFLVRALPAAIAQKPNAEEMVRAVVDEMVEKTVSRKLLVPAEEVLITASCKMAVKAGDPLTFDEMNALIADLLACDNPYTCPHGRPIFIELSHGEMDRRFGR